MSKEPKLHFEIQYSVFYIFFAERALVRDPYKGVARSQSALAEVRSAAGHARFLTTSAYLHVAVDDEGTLGNLFEFGA